MKAIIFTREHEATSPSLFGDSNYYTDKVIYIPSLKIILDEGIEEGNHVTAEMSKVIEKMKYKECPYYGSGILTNIKEINLDNTLETRIIEVIKEKRNIEQLEKAHSNKVSSITLELEKKMN